MTTQRSLIEATQIVGIAQALTAESAISKVADMLDELKASEVKSINKIVEYHKGRAELALDRLEEARKSVAGV